ncbi:MAG: alkaline phosphatase family protein [Candidatus Fimenecus sp.]
MFLKPEYKNEKAYSKYVDESGVFSNKLCNALPQTVVAKAVRAHMDCGGKTKKVAVIGFDGARADSLVPVVKSNYDPYITRTKYSALEELKEQGGIYLCYTGGEKGETQETSTPQGWATLLTGKWAKETGIYSNETLTKEKTFLYEYAEKGKKTVFNGIWPVHFTHTYKAEAEKGKKENLPVEFYQCEDNDDILTEKMIKSVTEDNCDISFCILELPDHMGHETKGGFNNKNPQYVKAVTLCDKNAYKIIKAIESRPTYEDEDWLIIISADHGGHLRRHGTQLITDRTVFIASNKKEYFESDCNK